MDTLRRSIVLSLIFVLGVGLATPALLEGARSGGDNDNAAKQTTSLYEKGVAKAEAGEYAAAERLFARSIEKGTKVAESYNMLGYVKRKQGKTREAIRAYHEALDRKPDFPEAREYLGETYLQGVRKQLEILRESLGTDHETYRELKSALRDLSEEFLSGRKERSSQPEQPEQW